MFFLLGLYMFAARSQFAAFLVQIDLHMHICWEQSATGSGFLRIHVHGV